MVMYHIRNRAHLNISNGDCTPSACTELVGQAEPVEVLARDAMRPVSELIQSTTITRRHQVVHAYGEELRLWRHSWQLGQSIHYPVRHGSPVTTQDCAPPLLHQEARQVMKSTLSW
jgi:hypothetical protein